MEDDQLTIQIDNAPTASYAINGGPEIVIFVRTGFAEPLYHVIRENPYGTWKDDACVMNKQQVYNQFGIMLEI